MPIFELAGERPEFPADGQYWIAETAVVIGRVRLKSEASVWWGAVLRGDNEWIEVGERSQIQDNATIHTDPGFPLTIGRGCIIGHNVVLHGCTVGDNSLIGMGAILLNGAPARAIRALDETAEQMIAAGAEIYVRRWKNYAGGLKRIG